MMSAALCCIAPSSNRILWLSGSWLHLPHPRTAFPSKTTPPGCRVFVRQLALLTALLPARLRPPPCPRSASPPALRTAQTTGQGVPGVLCRRRHTPAKNNSNFSLADMKCWQIFFSKIWKIDRRVLLLRGFDSQGYEVQRNGSCSDAGQAAECMIAGILKERRTAVKRKKTEAVKLVVLEITFECPNGHPIVREHLHFRPLGTKSKRSGVTEIDDTLFPLECHECGWKGQKRGCDRVLLQPAARNR